MRQFHKKIIWENLLTSGRLCPTWIQTCMLSIDGQGFDIDEQGAYLDFLAVVIEKVKLQGVMLYTLARPSMQPEAGAVREVIRATIK